MPSMDDYTTRLFCDASKYTSGTSAAVGGLNSLSGSVNSIMGQLNRQKAAYENAGRSTLDWIAADKKASDEVKEHTRSLLAHVDALRKLASAVNDPALKMMNATRATNDPFQVGLRHMGNMQSANEASVARDAADPFLSGMSRWQRENDAWQRGMSQMRANHDKELAERKKQAAERKTQAERDAKDPFLSGMARHRRENDPFQRGLDNLAREKSQEEQDREYRINAARKRDAFEEEDRLEKERQNDIRTRTNERKRSRQEESDEERKRVTDVRENSRRMAQDRRDDANVNRQLDEQGYFRRGRPGHENQEKKDNRQWAGVEGFRAIEDFAQGSAYGGLRGGLLAASNNISQMGAAFGAAGAMAGSAASTLIVLGSNAYDAWRKSVDGTHQAEAALKNYNRELGETIPHLMRIRDLRIESQDVRDNSAEGAAGKAKQLDREIERDKEQQQLKDTAFEDFKKEQGLQGLTSQDLLNEKRRREQDPMPFTTSVLNTVFGHKSPVSETLSGLGDAALTNENIERFRKAQLEVQQGNREIVAKEALNLQTKGALIELQRNADREAEKSLDRADERRRRHERGAHDMTDMTDFDRQEMQNQVNEADRRKKMNDTESGYKWLKSRSTELAIEEADRKQVGGGSMLRSQIDYQEQMERIGKASRLGLIDPEERKRAEDAERKKRDRDLREAKYGNMTADGNSGFGSADIRSTAGVNAVMKAMRYSEQSQTISELKKNGEISADILRVQQEALELAKLNPLTVMDF